MENTGVVITLNSILNYSQNRNIVTRASGPHIWIDGEKFIDMSMGSGTHILGHRDNIFVRNGTLFGALKPFDCDKYADMLRRKTQHKHFILCNTGAEATMRAVRIARAYTNREKVLLFDGYWHGGCDTFLECSGVPQCVKNLIVKTKPNESCLDLIRTNEFAVVIIEPIQSSYPIERVNLIKKILDVCNETRTPLCFDEMITGFRLSQTGAAGKFGITSHLATYGKIAGGGFPIGIVSGTEELMQTVLDKNITLGGTFSGNPVSIANGYHVLSRLGENEYKYLDEIGKLLREKIKRRVAGEGSINRIIFTDEHITCRSERDEKENQEEKSRFFKALWDKKVYVGGNGLLLTSVSHTKDIIDDVISRINSI